MRKLFLFFLCILQPFFAYADRAEKSKLAEEQLLNLHFFYDGKGMHISPGLSVSVSGKDSLKKEILKNRWGFQIQNEQAMGTFPVRHQGFQMDAVGCVACHSGKAAGVFIVGLGNKNIDVGRIGQDGYLMQKLWGDLQFKNQKNQTWKTLHQDSLKLFSLLGHQKITNLTQGLVPTSVIRTWFYDQANVPWPKNMPRAANKVPAFWGYGEKRKAGSFSDGFGHGVLPGWAVAVELVAGQTPENVRKYEKKIHEAEDLLADLLPPKYPFSIDQNSANLGKKVFENTCAGCHGSYDRDARGLPVYEAPKYISWNTVKTDSDRISGMDQIWFDVVDQNPLRDLIQRTSLRQDRGAGYFAPKLYGIWARFPYLHNASVPTLADLLTPEKDRPKKFSLVDAGEKYRFDEKRLGLRLSNAFPPFWSKRAIYDTRLQGQSNQGHPFGTNLSSQEKKNLIEFLKTL